MMTSLTTHWTQVRTLETVIRLSSAAAKARLSGQVEVIDVDVATGLMDYVLKTDKTADSAARRALDADATVVAALVLVDTVLEVL